jgi:hypothetical protein
LTPSSYSGYQTKLSDEIIRLRDKNFTFKDIAEQLNCEAVLTPMAFAARRPDSATQTWMLTISTEEAIWMRQDDGSFSFRTDCWEI